MPKVNIRHIEAFNAVMNEGSVSKGAYALSVTQPAVTKLIQSFEEYCQFKLFNRDTGRLVPTLEALSLFEETSRLVDGLVRVERTAQSIRRLERGRLTVLALPAISAHLIPRAIGRLLRPEQDGIDFTLLTRSSSQIEVAMVSRIADFALSLLPSDHPSLLCEPLGHLDLICAVPAQHPLAQTAAVSLNDLGGVPMISLSRHDLISSVVQAAFMRAGVSITSKIEVSLSETACALVAEGVGVAVVTALSAAAPANQNLVFRPLEGSAKMTLWCITARHIDRSLISLRFAEAIRHELANLR